MANEYLQRTPTSTGNRMVWTWSGWIKLAGLPTTGTNGDRGLFSAVNATTGGADAALRFSREGGSNPFQLQWSSSRYNVANDESLSTAAVFRDTGNWMHVLLIRNTTVNWSSERIRFYVNGIEQDKTQSNAVSQYETAGINETVSHAIGDHFGQGRAFQGEMCDVFFVDGQAMLPEVFGFYKEGKGYQSSGYTRATDFRPGQWSPHSPRKIKTEIERKGGFGVNGFYLPMNDSSNPGADFHCAPNSIIKLKGEDLPQPRNGAPTTSDAFVSQLRPETGTLGFDGCIKLDGNQGLSIADTAALDLGTGDFTIEGFYYLRDEGTYHALFDFRGSGGDGHYPALFRDTTENKLYYYVNSSVRIDDISMRHNEWMHVAICKSSGTTRAFVDGVLAGSANDTHDYISRDLLIGLSASNSNDLYGFISNFRIVKGTALYTSNFTVPTAPLENVTNTILLCANSSTSATASTVTPSTISTIGSPIATKNELTGSIVLAVPGISTATGANLVTNGTFDTNTTGWTSQDATLSVDNGRIKVLTTNTNYGSALQTVTGLTVGQRYTFQVDMYYGNASLVTAISGASPSINSGWQSADYVWRTSFTATTTSLVIDFQMASQSNVYGFWDNVILKAEDAPRDYSADIKGSGTNKTLTPSGAGGVGYEIPLYYGSALNFPGGSTSSLATPSNSDFAFGTGDFTVEFWVKASTQHSYHQIFDTRGTVGNSTTGFSIGYTSGNFYIYTNTFNIQRSVSLGQFVHIVAEREGSNLTLYLNGVVIGVQNNFNLNLTNSIIYIGATGTGDTTQYFKGQVQDLRVYKGIAKYKGGFDVPKPYTPVGIESWRTVSDTCKNNFCIINSNATNGKYGLAEGNLSFTSTTTNWTGFMQGTLGFSTGKWYWETRADVDTDYHHLGIIGATNTHHDIADTYVYAMSYQSDGRFYAENNNTSTFANGKTHLNDGDIFQIAVDMDNKKMWFGVNGNWIDSGNPSAGSGENYNSTVGFNYEHYVPFYDAYGTAGLTANFGQNPTFGGHRTAGTNTDDNGRGLFAYDVPTGFLALCDDNFPAPAIPDPGKHMKTVLWTGDGNHGRSITGVGFKPDLIWIKDRGDTSSHSLFDSVRGAGIWLGSNSTSAEQTTFVNVYNTSFDNDGFSVGTDGAVNGSGSPYVAWCWKAGGPALSNNDGALTSQVSVNQTAGFSIATYTTPNGNATNFGHGLGKKPAFALFKARNDTGNWAVYHQSLGTNTIRLSTTDAKDTSANAFNSTAPTDTLMYLGTWAGTNGSNVNWVSYLWAEIEGYSKFGRYVGNGSADGTFVYCGFKPAWLLLKSESSGGWELVDSSRKPTNPNSEYLSPNANYAENPGSNNHKVDLYSNGFKITTAGGSDPKINPSGEGVIFAAFAESPFQTANAK